MQNGTTSELYTDDKKPSSNPNAILKSAKNFYTKEILFSLTDLRNEI